MLCSKKHLSSCTRKLLSRCLASSEVTSVRAHTTQQFSKNIGNPDIRPYNFTEKLHEDRWKLHWVNNMKRKALIEGEYAPEPRSSQVDWNLQAELHAFK